jgi:hypothetical protein
MSKMILRRPQIPSTLFLPASQECHRQSYKPVSSEKLESDQSSVKYPQGEILRKQTTKFCLKHMAKEY